MEIKKEIGFKLENVKTKVNSQNLDESLKDSFNIDNLKSKGIHEADCSVL
jgi:hypothetical protein